MKMFTGHFSVTGERNNHHLNKHSHPWAFSTHTHSYTHTQTGFRVLAIIWPQKYSQVVGEGAEPGWDGG